MVRTSVKSLALSLSMALAMPHSGASQSASGAFLAAQQAEFAFDFRRAAGFYMDGMFLDPDFLPFQRGAIQSYMALGELSRAAEIARGLLAQGVGDPVIYMAMLGGADDEAHLREIADTFVVPGQQLDPLTDGLVQGWALLGTGNTAAAMQAFDRVIRQEGLAPFGMFHKALGLAWSGDFDGAESLLSSEELMSPPTWRSALARAQVLSQLGRNPEALALLTEVFGPTPADDAAILIAALQQGKTLSFTLVKSPAEGIAEVFYTLAEALSGDEEDLYNLFYARLAGHLRPDHVETVLLTAQILDRLELHDLATEAYGRIPKTSSHFLTSALGIAETMRERDRVEASIAYLEELLLDFGQVATVHVTLGDHLRQQKRYAEAAQAYSRGIELGATAGLPDWYAHYVRAICYERLDDWPKAEADFRRALELQPNHPSVLNYLGYSLVERREKLDEALAMIETAVTARPDSGYIVDSLGWVFYRLGRFEEAVAPMELAAELLATDPIVNDHLGDVYWMVGRVLEADFQWRRALSFGPEPEEANRIRRKLEVGLDQVLTEEGAVLHDR